MKPLEILQAMDRTYKRAKYPNVPDNALPLARYTQKDANSITAAILAFLRLKGHYASRIQSQGQYNAKLDRWTLSMVRRGIGDIMATIEGRMIMIEVKAGKDRLSAHQVETKTAVEKSGGIYLVCKSFDDFYQWYQQINN
jgi:hypothetical protein